MSTDVKPQRLQKVMAEAGVASRRACEQIIVDGRVRVNGKIVTELGTLVTPGRDRIEVDNKAVISEPTVVLILNKPRGVVCTASDPEGRETVIDLVKGYRARLFPVGRLDYNTSGALLMTNDGELAYALTHPKFGAEKTYLIKVHGKVSEPVLEQWRKGVTLDDNTATRPAKEVFKVEESDGFTWLQVTIKEGKNRQLRRMAEATGLRVSKLKRIAFAGITIERLPIGTWRELTEHEMYKLKRDYATPARRAGSKSGYNFEDIEDESEAPAAKKRVKRGWGGTSEPEHKSSSASTVKTSAPPRRSQGARPDSRGARPAARGTRPAAPAENPRSGHHSRADRSGRNPAPPSDRPASNSSPRPARTPRPTAPRKGAPSRTRTTPERVSRRDRGR